MAPIDETPYAWRRNKSYLYAGLAGLCAYRGIPLLWHRDSRWAVFFWLGIAWAFVSLFRLERRNLTAVRAEDAAAAQDPKHLYQPALGFTASPELRGQLAGGLIVSGLGVLYGAFQHLHIGMVFWGASLTFLGVILLLAF